MKYLSEHNLTAQVLWNNFREIKAKKKWAYQQCFWKRAVKKFVMTDAYENEYDFQCVHILKIVNVWLVSRQTKKSES